jgi:hypothetical protein
MLWLGFIIGFFAGTAVFVVRYNAVYVECKRLDREIAADNLKCAQEERRAAALRVIAENERQASRWSN